MGFRDWLLRPYIDRLEALEAEVEAIKEGTAKVREEVLSLTKALNHKADKEDLNDVRLRLNSILKTLDGVIQQLDTMEISLTGDQLLKSDEAQKELILKLIRAGYNSPKGLKSMAPFGNKKLYKILKELEAQGLVRKIKKGRKVYYITTAEAEEG